LQTVECGVKGEYSHGKGLISQLANGVGLAVRFLIITSSCGSYVEVLWDRVAMNVSMRKGTGKVWGFFLHPPTAIRRRRFWKRKVIFKTAKQSVYLPTQHESLSNLNPFQTEHSSHIATFFVDLLHPPTLQYIGKQWKVPPANLYMQTDGGTERFPLKDSYP
jgi:hypothetical protein